MENSINLESRTFPVAGKLKRASRMFSLLAVLMALITSQAAAQTSITIKGTVLAAADKIPVIGANVVVEGTTNGTVTDIDGLFSISAPSTGTLVVSYIGCKTQKIKINGKKEFVIMLEEESIGLNDVVVVGYGSQRKSDLTGGIVAVGSEKLEMVTTNNLMDKLAGQVPGLNITSGNARPGQEQSIRVRGENSLSADNSPLIVLDGIPYSGGLSDIDPDIIENLSVLKDASSAAIYGSRGANGVILIQTKKGKKGAAKVSYKGQIGFAQPERRLNMMKGDEYVKYIQDFNRVKYGYTGDKLKPESLLNSNELQNWKNGVETDWQDVMFRNALTTSHQLSVSGGTDNTTYMASISHLKQDGVVENTGLKRTNIALNVTQVLNKWLTVGMGTQAIQKDYGGEQPYLEAGLKMSPYGTYKDEEGRYEDYPMYPQTLYYNPMANLNATNDKTSHNVFISTFAEVQFPVEGLSYRTNFGYNYMDASEGLYYGRNTLSGKKVNGEASIKNIHYWDYTWENLLKYNRTFGKHKLDATALFSMQQTNRKEAQESGQSFVNDESEYHNMAGAEKNKVLSSALKETAMLSYMLRVNYSYANKYMLTVTGRSDGYSAFGANNKYAFFPSVAAAWNLSSEDFMGNTSDWLDMMKIRLSYGTNGNQAINPYQTLDRLSLTNYIWGDNGTTVNGVYIPSDGIGNPNLKWETSRTVNAGVDYSFFGGRLSGSVDFYVVNTQDLLMSRVVPSMNGYNSIMDNVGKTRNKGIEIIVNSVNIQKKDFSWNTTVNFSLNRDKIIELRGDGKDDITNKWFIGEPLRVFYDYNVIGTWQTDDQFTNSEGKAIQEGAVPGSAKLEDVDGDGRITAQDKKIIGSKLPSFLMSMSNRFNYKDFYFSFLLNGVFGQTKEMHDYNFDRWMPDFNYISGMDYWTPENPTNEMTSPAYIPYSKHSFYKKMSYVQVKNLTLGYTFPKPVLSSLGISALAVNVSVNNLFTFSNVKNALNFDAIDIANSKGVLDFSKPSGSNMISTYPSARSYMLGLNLTF